MSEEKDIHHAAPEDISPMQPEPSDPEQRTNRFQREGRRQIQSFVRDEFGLVGMEFRTITGQLRSVSIPNRKHPRTFL